MNPSLFFLKRQHKLIGTRVVLAFIAFSFVSDFVFDTFHHHLEAHGGLAFSQDRISRAAFTDDIASERSLARCGLHSERSSSDSQSRVMPSNHSHNSAPGSNRHQPCQASHSHQHPVPLKEQAPQCFVATPRPDPAVVAEVERDEYADLSAAGSRAPPNCISIDRSVFC